jgi:hypothetical protein
MGKADIGKGGNDEEKRGRERWIEIVKDGSTQQGKNWKIKQVNKRINV